MHAPVTCFGEKASLFQPSLSSALAGCFLLWADLDVAAFFALQDERRKIAKTGGRSDLSGPFQVAIIAIHSGQTRTPCRSYLSGFDAGRRNPTIQTLTALAKALKLNISELLGSAAQTKAPRRHQNGRLRLGSTIRKLRQNRNPALRNVARIAEGLNISVAALFSANSKEGR